MNYLIVGIIGLIGGVTSGLFGVGGGVIMVPAMMFFMGMGIKTSVGTSLAVIVPTAMMGTYQHNRFGQVDWRMALSLVPFTIGGGFLGSWLTTQIPADNLKRAFGGFLVLIGLRLLLFK